MVKNKLKPSGFSFHLEADNSLILVSVVTKTTYWIAFTAEGFQLSFLKESPPTSFDAQGSSFSTFNFQREVSVYTAIEEVGREPRFLG